jgi:carboxyl-terminal processing protease
MKPTRSIALLISVVVVLFLLGGGLAAEVGAEESSFHEVVIFSEVLSLVLDNYVDPLDVDRLLHGAYEGMLSGLDAHGAYLTPEEVAEWKNARDDRELSDPGISVLRAGHALQVVAVDPGSPAEAAGLTVGDQIRKIDGLPIRELSLDQAWRRIRGAPGSTVRLDVLHSSDGFRREEIEVARGPRTSRPYDLKVERGIAVLRILDPRRISPRALGEELDDVRSRGVGSLLVDLRNVADTDPRGVKPAAAVFASGPLLLLKDRAGKTLESVESEGAAAPWQGAIAVLVNGATAGSAEAFASLVQSDLGGKVVGEQSYGLGAEPRLYEMDDGSGLLISAAQWETAGGGRWNGEGVEPDEVIHGKGADYEARLADQLEQALEFLERQWASTEPEREAA